MFRARVDGVHSRLPHHEERLHDEIVHHVAEFVSDGIDAHYIERPQMLQEKPVGEIEYEQGQVGEYQGEAEIEHSLEVRPMKADSGLAKGPEAEQEELE